MFVCYDGKFYKKEVVRHIFVPVSQAGSEKVEKMHFIDFDLDFLPKQKGSRDCFGICY